MKFVTKCWWHSAWTAWPSKLEPTSCPKTSVTFYQSVQHKVPQERRCHLHCSRSLKSSMLVPRCDIEWNHILQIIVLIPLNFLLQCVWLFTFVGIKTVLEDISRVSVSVDLNYESHSNIQLTLCSFLITKWKCSCREKLPISSHGCTSTSPSFFTKSEDQISTSVICVIIISPSCAV